MEGRDTPSRGLDTTAKFIAMNLSRWGFKPAGDDGSYLQKIDLSRDLIDKSETRAALNDLLDRARLAGNPPFPQPAGEQVTSLSGGEQVQGKRAGTFRGDQAHEVVAAGHDGQAPWRTRQQRPDLLGVSGIVEHDQHSAPGELAAIQRRLGV